MTRHRCLSGLLSLGFLLLIVFVHHPDICAQSPLGSILNTNSATDSTSSPRPTFTFNQPITSFPPEKPVKVEVLVFVYDFGEINQVIQKYNLNAVVVFAWADSRLAYEASETEKERTLPISGIWWPDFEVVNAIDYDFPANSDVTVLPDGTVIYMRKLNTALSSELNLRRFPFDRQELKLLIESSDHSINELEFDVSDEPSQWRKEAFLSEWALEKITQQVVKTRLVPDADEYSQARFTIHIRRRAGFYIWKGFLPLLLITSVAWFSLWVPLFNVPTGPLPLSIGALLTATTFIFTIAGTLPRISYLTLFDAFFLICYISIFITLAVNVYLTDRGIRNPSMANRVRYLARRWVPGSFAISLVIIGVLFLT